MRCLLIAAAVWAAACAAVCTSTASIRDISDVHQLIEVAGAITNGDEFPTCRLSLAVRGARRASGRSLLGLHAATAMSDTPPLLEAPEKRSEAETAALCLLSSLSNNNGPRTRALMLAGDALAAAGLRAPSEACYDAAAKILPRLSEYSTLDYLGPFAIGKPELDGDPATRTAAAAGVESVLLDRGSKRAYPTELTAGGSVSWTTLRPSGDGSVHIAPEVEWQRLLQQLGGREVLEFQSWVARDVLVTRAGRWALRCAGVHTAYVDGVPVVGDQYNNGAAEAVVSLGVGVHVLAIRYRAVVAGAFACQWRPVGSAGGIAVFAPDMAPDIVGGRLFHDLNLLSVPVLNEGESWLEKPRVEIKGAEVAASNRRQLPPRFDVAPGQRVRIPVRIVLTSGALDGDGHDGGDVPYRLRVVAERDGRTVSSEWVDAALRRRGRGQSFVFTFVDHDGSVQQSGCVLPKPLREHAEEDAMRQRAGGLELWDVAVPVLLSLHGTGVTAQGQADAFKLKRKGAADYEFGVEGMWLVAPDRHGAHNWEGVGFWTALAAVRALERATAFMGSAKRTHEGLTCRDFGTGSQVWREHTLCSAVADADRVVVTGHSMGGHGAWHAAVRLPDHVIAVQPSAGWISKEQYGDSNAFMRLDVSLSWVEPALSSILWRSTAEHDADLMLPNLVGLPVHLRVGAADGTVSPWYTRRMTRALLANGADRKQVSVEEVPNKEHWWWDTKAANDGGAVNDAKLRRFFQSVLARESVATGGASVLPRSFTLTTMNPGSGGFRGGLRVLQTHVPVSASRVDVERNADGESEVWLVKTRNVRRLQFRPQVHNPVRCLSLDDLSGACTVTLNFDNDYPGRRGPSIHMCHTADGRGGGVWRRCSVDDESYLATERGPATSGPARQVPAGPLMIVVGTLGDEQLEGAYTAAALYLANSHLMTSGASVAIVRDVDATGDSLRGCNLILLGGPATNALSSSLLDAGPDRSTSHCVQPTVQFSDNDTAFVLGSNSTGPRFCGPGVGLVTTLGLWHPPVEADVDVDADAMTSTASSWSPLAALPHDMEGAANMRQRIACRDGRVGCPGLALLIAGADVDGLSNALELAVPTIPPMTRAPFTNLVPDYVVVGPETRALGPGGFLAAGFFGAQWEWREDAAWTAHPVH